MIHKTKEFIRKNGLFVGLAIIIPGGELFLLGKVIFEHYKKKKKLETL